MRVLSSFSDSPRWASHPASRALTCSACCLERQQAARSSAYADLWVMPALSEFYLVKSGLFAYGVGMILRPGQRPGFLVRVSGSS